MRKTHPNRGQLQLECASRTAIGAQAHSPIRPPRRYPLLDVRPVSGLANASRLAKRLPTPRGAVTSMFRLRFAYRCGGSSGIGAIEALSPDSRFTRQPPFRLIEHLTTCRRLMHRAGNNNSEGKRSALRTMRRKLSPLTMCGRNVVLLDLMASLTRESDEGMWYTSSVRKTLHAIPRLPPQL
jgi:hypothetical protein